MLNADKTDLIIIGAKQKRNEIVDYFPVKILGKDADTVRNLGIVFDRHICFHQSISQLYLRKSCFYHIRYFRRTLRLSLVTAKTISVALINSRLDYCNSLLNNIVNKHLSKRQRIWSLCLALVVVKAPRFSPSLSLL